MRQYHFLKSEIAAAENTITEHRLPEVWLAAALTLAARSNKPPSAAAGVLAAAARGKNGAWTTLQSEYRVNWDRISPPLPRDRNANLELYNPVMIDAARNALEAFLIAEFNLDEPSTEERLAARVDALEKQVKALTKAAKTTATV